MKNLEIDRLSLLATCSVDVSCRALEHGLALEGYTLGYHPPGAGRLTLRRALEKRIPNRDALLYGEIDDLCVAVQASRGAEILRTRNLPRAATGPDFKKILIGSGQRHARLTHAVLRISPKPEARETVRLGWTARKDRDAFVKAFWSSGIRPVAFSATARSACVTLEGTRESVAAERQCLHRLVRQTKGRAL